MIEFRDAHIDDATRIDIRAADCREIWRTYMSDPNLTVALSIGSSGKAYTALLDGEIICIFGVATTSVIGRVGAPWLIGSDLVAKVPRRFLVESKERVQKMKDGYSLLKNYVDVENSVSIKWLKWLGFTIDEEIRTHGLAKKPFRKFTMECLECV